MNWKSTKEAQRKDRPKLNFGIARIAIVRSMFLISFYQVSMVFFLTIREGGWTWWYVLMPISFVAYAIFDRLVTYRQELSQNIINSEEFMALINNVEDIKETLEKHEKDEVEIIRRILDGGSVELAFLHIDLGISHDAAGLCISHLKKMERVPFGESKKYGVEFLPYR